MVRSFLYSVRQAFRQIIRNKPMLLTSLFSITAMMLILGVFFIFAANVSLLTQSARDQFDMVEVFLKDSLSEERLEKLRFEINNLPYVDHVDYISKNDALKIMKERWGDHGYMLDGLSGNPLPASLQVRLNDLDKSDEFVRKTKGLRGVEDISCRQDDINKIMNITNYIQIGAMVIILFLMAVSIVVVINTIKLTVLARGRAISIMRYVGATNWFIRGPFLMEGIIMGLMASVISALIIFCIYSAFLANYSEKILILFSAKMIPVSSLAGMITVMFLVIGIVIGTVGSLISMRRFLKR